MEELTIAITTPFINKDLKKYTTSLKTCGTNIRKNYLKIARTLHEIDKSECYLDDGYESTFDYASKVLNLGKTTVYNMIKIGASYINETGDHTIFTESGNDYGLSQLQALIPIGIETAQRLHNNGDISPDMSVRQIKALIKSKGYGHDSFDDTEEGESDNNVVDSDSGDEVVIAKCVGTIQFFDDQTIITEGDVPEEIVDALNKLLEELENMPNK